MPEVLIRTLWQLFSDQKWDEAKNLFHPQFIAEWPQSRERFIGGDDFVEMNRAYPGNHSIEVLNIVAADNQVVSSVYIYADTGQKAFATSFFLVEDCKIKKATEFWGEPYPAPDSRRTWAKAY